MPRCSRWLAVWLAALASLIGSNTANGQSVCPAVTFLNAGTVAVRPTDSSHLALLRQNDGSYARYEIADVPPYHVSGATPHAERQFAACVPHMLPTTRVPTPVIAANALGVASQSLVTAAAGLGRYVIAWAENLDNSKPGIKVDLLDGNLGLIRETRFDDLGLVVALLFADLNGDGNPDLVALQSGGQPGGNGGFVWVLMGRNNGTFQEPESYDFSGFAPNSMTASDLNGDGKPDIAVTSAFSPDGQISIYLGNGDGTFHDERIIFQHTPANSIVAADLNQDGKIDLAFRLVDNDNITTSKVAVALGLGDGTFAAPVSFSTAPSTSLAAGDVNGDGRLDLVTNGVTVLLGDGKGGFPNRHDYFANTGNTSVILGDFDGDGNSDITLGMGNLQLFTGHPFPPVPTSLTETQTVLFGRGDGTFIAAPTSPGVTPALAADFNGDGLPDLVSLDFFNKRVAIVQAVGDGTFQPVFQYAFPAGSQQYPRSAVAGDFNRDGKTDLAVATTACTSSPNDPGEILIFPGKGDGTLGTPSVLSTAPGGPFLAAGDLNRDGNTDLAVVLRADDSCGRSVNAADALMIFLGNGHGGFTSPVVSYSAGPGAAGIVMGDFDGDGRTDLVVTNQGNALNPAGNVTVLTGTGAGTFFALPAIETGATGPGPYRVAAADFNRDGKLDLLVTLVSAASGESGGALVLFGKGDGTFQPPVLYPDVPPTAMVGDLNSDGIADLIYFVGAYRLGNGDGTFKADVSPPGAGTPALILGDFNKDGKLDLVGYGGFGPVTLFNTSPPASPLTIVSAATFASGPVAADSIASAFGTHLATATAAAPSGGLPTVLAGTTATVQDASGEVREAHLFYVSPTQVNLAVPAGTGNGTATVTILSADGQTGTGQVQVASVAPSLFTENGNGLAAAYVLHVKAGNVQTTAFVFTGQSGSATPVPIDLGPPTEQVYLTLFGTGIRNAAAGQVTVKVNGLDATVSYAGPQFQFTGLDQVNVLLPHALAGSGDSSLVLTAAGTKANSVHVTFK